MLLEDGIALADSKILKAGNELSDQDLGLCSRYRVRGIVGVSEDLHSCQLEMFKGGGIRFANSSILIVTWLIKYRREDILRWTWNMFLRKKGHCKLLIN
jgi:hypothetical protein